MNKYTYKDSIRRGMPSEVSQYRDGRLRVARVYFSQPEQSEVYCIGKDDSCRGFLLHILDRLGGMLHAQPVKSVRKKL